MGGGVRGYEIFLSPFSFCLLFTATQALCTLLKPLGLISWFIYLIFLRVFFNFYFLCS